jgi:hypothetical protein
MQGQRARCRVACVAHRAIGRAGFLGCGANRDRASFDIGGFEGQMYLHGLPLLYCIAMLRWLDCKGFSDTMQQPLIFVRNSRLWTMRGPCVDHVLGAV